METIKLTEVLESVSVTHKFGIDKIVFLNTSDVLEGMVLHHRLSDVEGLPGQAKKTFQKGDILFSEIRPNNKRYAWVDFEATNYVASTKLMVLRLKTTATSFNSKFLYHYLISLKNLEILQQIAESRSGTFPQITFSQLSAIEVPVLPILKQNEIVGVLDLFENKAKSNFAETILLNLAKNQLLYKMTGLPNESSTL